MRARLRSDIMAERRVLSVASECAPLVKTGGLADVVGALPGALAPHGWHTRTLLPGYPAVMKAAKGFETVGEPFEVYGGKARVLFGQADGLDLYILDAPKLFERDGLYADASGRDHFDNPERFATLCAVARMLAGGADEWTPDVVHAHDWQAGFAPVYVRRAGLKVGTVFTIHNIAFMGLAPMARRAALDLTREREEAIEFWGQVSALKAGMVRAHRVNTVSPTYARQLRGHEAMGLDGVVRMRGSDFSGILNGIDADVWNPATDPHIKTFKTPKGKKAAKKALRREFGLPDADGPLCAVVTRMTHQKGLDILLDALPALTDRGGQVVLLGTGEPGLEEAWRRRADAHPHVAVRIGYDEGLSHRMYAGADAVLVPSRFEPCGLTQLYGLRYGALPLVARTGGLADTVIDANTMALADGVATGLTFFPVEADALAQALLKLVRLWHDRAVWERMQANAMRQKVGWERSGASYAALYESAWRAAQTGRD